MKYRRPSRLRTVEGYHRLPHSTSTPSPTSNRFAETGRVVAAFASAARKSGGSAGGRAGAAAAGSMGVSRCLADGGGRSIGAAGDVSRGGPGGQGRWGRGVPGGGREGAGAATGSPILASP